MAHTDLEALKERLRNAKPKAKRTYRKRPKISEATQAELMIKLRESSEFLNELKLELDALTYQAYKKGLTYQQLADALMINESAIAKRLMRVKDKLAN